MAHRKNAKTVVSRGAREAHWWLHSPPNNVARVQISASKPYVGWVCCWLSPLVPEVFLPGTPVFPSPHKPTFPNSNSTRNQVDEEPPCGCATSNSLFIYLFIYINVNKVKITICFRKVWPFTVGGLKSHSVDLDGISFLYSKSSALIGSINIQCLGKVIQGLVHYSIWHYLNNQMEIVFKLW